MKILVCYEYAILGGHASGDAQFTVDSLTLESLNAVRDEIVSFAKKESYPPVQNIIFRSVTRLDE